MGRGVGQNLAVVLGLVERAAMQRLVVRHGQNLLLAQVLDEGVALRLRAAEQVENVGVVPAVVGQPWQREAPGPL